MRNLQSTIKLLLDKAGPHLSREELENLSTADEEVTRQTRHLRELAELIALAMDDPRVMEATPLAALFWHIAASADQIAALNDIANGADRLLWTREQRQRAPGGQP